MTKMRLRTVIVATALIAVASLCGLAALYDETQARVAAHGTWCERTGRTYNANGDLVESGLWWGDDGLRQEVER